MRNLIVFSGSGVSAESGIRTFRDSGGLWEEHDIYDVATPEAWNRNPDLVQRFYNDRRKQVLEADPNPAHHAISKLQARFNVTVITQNVDDLHERAGSKQVIHLHGELRKARSTGDPTLIYDIEGSELKMSDTCEKGYPLRPHIVWFGEMVPMMEEAARICRKAELFIVVGTSLEVYPAASLIHMVPEKIDKYYIDPAADTERSIPGFKIIKENAGVAMPRLTEILFSN